MKVINLGANNSIINQFVAELRDVNIQKDRMRFRNNIRRIGNLMAYEISKTLKYKETDVVTPLATAKMNLPIDNIVIGTVFRAGLPFHQGFLDIFDQAIENATISMFISSILQLQTFIRRPSSLLTQCWQLVRVLSWHIRPLSQRVCLRR